MGSELGVTTPWATRFQAPDSEHLPSDAPSRYPLACFGTSPEFFTPSGGAKLCACHPNSVKRLADELGIQPKRRANGLRIFSLPEIQKIAAGLARRRKETLR
jgi:hypothetical protein